MTKILNQYRQEGPRFVAIGTYKGVKIEVVTGWDVNSDKWPVHVYLNGARRVDVRLIADSHGEAVSAGEATAIQLIDSGS